MIKTKIPIDFKGSILLAITITSFLLALTFLESAHVDSKSNINNGFPIFYSTVETVLPFIISGIISLILFIYVEKHTKFPLIDFNIILKPPILFSSIIIMIVGISMFMVFQTIPILVQTSSTCWIWRKCNRHWKGSIAFCNSSFNIRTYFWNHYIQIRVYKTGYLWFGLNHIRFCNNIAISFIRVINFNWFGSIICRIISSCRWSDEYNYTIFTTRIFRSNIGNEQYVENSR